MAHSSHTNVWFSRALLTKRPIVVAGLSIMKPPARGVQKRGCCWGHKQGRCSPAVVSHRSPPGRACNSLRSAACKHSAAHAAHRRRATSGMHASRHNSMQGNRPPRAVRPPASGVASASSTATYLNQQKQQKHQINHQDCCSCPPASSAASNSSCTCSLASLRRLREAK